MTSVSVGTDFYGPVDDVVGTSVQTKFFMLSFVPLVPLESFYVGTLVSPDGRNTTMKAIRLRDLSTKSVAHAYLRTVCLLTAVIAGLGLIVQSVSIQPLMGASWGTPLLASVLLGGIVVGLVTYQTARCGDLNEVAVRAVVGSWTGIAADPANADPSFTARLNDSLDRQIHELGFADASMIARDEGADTRAIELAMVRLRSGSDEESRRLFSQLCPRYRQLNTNRSHQSQRRISSGD